MRFILVVNLFTFVCQLHGQPLRDINYNYLYDPAQVISVQLKPVRQGEQWIVLYKLQVRDSTFKVDDFSIEWGIRQTLADKENTPDGNIQVKELHRNKSGSDGMVHIPVGTVPKILVAKAIQIEAKRAWFFYTTLEPNFPLNDYATVNDQLLLNPFIKNTDKISLSSTDTRVISYYNDNFPAALPPFAEAQTRVSKAIEPDSTFTAGGDGFILPLTGLYLVQKDTSATEGLAIRVQDDYPRLARITSLAGPLAYICARDEITRLNYAKNDKRAFDRIILSITNDTDRARKLIRNYFRRVELANQYFTSYKEGWKTDRGMIFIIFGLPDEVFRFNDREVWNYKNDLYKITFNFSKASSIFDPENYVLIRENRFRETWLETVDLWRSARF
jgi:GWxTD domain-containing protein